MGILFFITNAKLKSFWKQSYKEWLETIPSFLFMAICAINGIIFSGLLDSNKIAIGSDYLNVKDLIQFLILSLIPIFNFIPNYKRRADPIPRCYPITTFKRIMLGVIIEFLSPAIISLCVFIVTVFLCANTFFLEDASISFLLIAFAISFTRALKGFIESEWAIKDLIFLLVTLVAASTAILVHNLFIAIPIILLSTYIAGVVEELLETKRKAQRLGHMSWHLMELFPFYFSQVRKALVLSFAIKLVLFIFSTSGSDGLFVWMRFVLISPLMLFTYIYNNSWGFFRSIWQEAQSRTSGISDRVKIYVKLIVGPLTIDATLTFAILLFFNQLEPFHLFVYFMAMMNMMVVGFIVSIYFPINVRDGINPLKTKPSTSIVGMLTDFSLVTLFWIPNWYPQLYFIVPLITFCILTICYGLIKRNFSSKVRQIFSVI